MVEQTYKNRLDVLREETLYLRGIYVRKPAALGGLKKTVLHRAFAG